MSTVPRRLGRYELREPLGRGGMAEVWKAFDTQLQRYVAIKVLHANLQTDPDFIARFIREAQTVAALRHANIVQIYDFHTSEGREAGVSESDAIAYMVMEYIKGWTLADYIRGTSRQKHFPPAAEIIRLFTPISLAIDYAHQHGMIHRDIKPANILLDKSHTARNPMGEPILSDFGLAKVLNSASQTVTGAVMGTPLYISPEQLQNRPVTKQADLYSLGVVLYEIFTGEPPFHGDSVTGIMMQHLTDTPAQPQILNPNLPPFLSEVLLKSLAKNPAERFSSASAMTAAVARAFNLPVPEDLMAAISSSENTQLLGPSIRPINVAGEGTGEQSGGKQGKAPTYLANEAKAQASITPTVPALGQAEEQTIPPDSEGAGKRRPYYNEAATVQSSEMIRDASANTPVLKTELDSGSYTLPAFAAESGADVKQDADLIHDNTQSQQQMTSRQTASAETPANAHSKPSTSAQAPLTWQERTQASGAPTMARPTPPTSNRLRMRIVLAVLLICILVGSGLGALFLLNRNTTTSTTGSSSVVGQAYFVSSGQLNSTLTQGSNDEFQIDLKNIPAPASGNSYYAWLLPDKSQVEGAPILLGKVAVNAGAIHYFYPGDTNHTNLLQTSSQFLITEENVVTTPDAPTPDLNAWRYYAEIPQTRAPGQAFSMLDHLRHLLTDDPILQSFHLAGGLDIWTNRNTQKVLSLAGSARVDWNSKDYDSTLKQVVAILDYLDGSKLVQQDVPAGTPILANPTFVQVGLLELEPGLQNPPGYLYHIALHLNGVLSSPGSSQYQRTLATQINGGINNVNGWLKQVRQDAIKLVGMDQSQLALPSTLTLLNDMVTQANNAYLGRDDPATGQLQKGVSQIYLDAQRLATFDVMTYKKS